MCARSTRRVGVLVFPYRPLSPRNLETHSVPNTQFVSLRMSYLPYSLSGNSTSMSYSSFRGQRGGRWPVRNFRPAWGGRTRVTEPAQGPNPPPVGELLQSISADEILDGSDKKIEVARITDCEFIASYNWMEQARPSIVVPGRRNRFPL